MILWKDLSHDEKIAALQNVAGIKHIPPQAVEKESRHLYDLERMMDEPFAVSAISNDELWNAISHHRQVFTSMKDVDYAPDIRGRITLVPPAPFVEEWKQDYEAMRKAMVFGDSLPFDKLIERIKILQERFRKLSE